MTGNGRYRDDGVKELSYAANVLLHVEENAAQIALGRLGNGLRHGPPLLP